MNFSSDGKIDDYSIYNAPYVNSYSLFEASYLWCGMHPPRFKLKSAFSALELAHLISKIRSEMPIEVLTVFDLFLREIGSAYCLGLDNENSLPSPLAAIKIAADTSSKYNHLKMSIVLIMYGAHDMQEQEIVTDKNEEECSYDFNNFKMSDQYRDLHVLVSKVLFSDDIFRLDALREIAEYYGAHPLAFFPELREPSVSIKIEQLTSENASLKDQAARLEGEIDQLKKNTPDYLNKSHRYYSPKLEAAIEAWRAIFHVAGQLITSHFRSLHNRPVNA